jgi:GTPase
MTSNKGSGDGPELPENDDVGPDDIGDETGIESRIARKGAAEFVDRQARITRAWVIHPDVKSDQNRRDPGPALEEAVALAAALPELAVVGSEVVRLPRVHPGMLFGSGKIEEIRKRMEEAEVELVLVDGHVGPVQQRNLEKAWKVKLLDRTGLILEIFSDRARTREGVLQVEMAALSYQRTRLVRAWTHLERQRGGLGFVGGPGETQIEADRRAIDDQLVRLKKQLAKVEKTRALHRAARAKVPFPIVALVGYTNAGKSTLFNRLTGADVFAKDMLFATLDPTMRRIALPSGEEIIMSDTVGFISDLPTELVAAFRATLEEVLDADLIVHVRDISHPQTAEQARDVMDILTTLGVAEGAPLIEVWNKIDLVQGEARAAVEVQAERTDDIFAVSALTGEGLGPLLEAVGDKLRDPVTQEELALPFSAGRKRAWLFDEGVVTSEGQAEDGYTIQVAWTARQRERFARLG